MGDTLNAPVVADGKVSVVASRGMIALSAVVIILVAFAAYHNSFSVPFILDDVSSITENRTIRHLWPIDSVLSPPQKGRSVSGRPVVNLSLAINYAFGGTSVRGYHATNLAIHILAGLTLFGVVRRTLRQPGLQARFGPSALPLALAVAVLWTVHPLQTEAVTYVVQRAESLMGLFYLLTLYCFIRGAESRRSTLWFVLSVVACLLGMATKEVMVSAPLVVLLYDRTFVAGSFQEAWKRRWWLYVGLAGTWLVLGWLVMSTSSRGGTAGFGSKVLWWEYALTQCWAVGHYLWLSVWPQGLVFDYGTELVRRAAQIVPGALMIVVLLGATARGLVKRSPVGFLGAWFFLLLAPSSTMLPVASQTVAEHRMYLPLAALVMLVVVVIYGLAGLRSLLVFLAMAVGLGILTVRRNQDYRSELSIWSDTVAKRPGNARAHSSLGNIFFLMGRVPEAIAEYEEGLRLKPDDAEAHGNLGTIFQEMGDVARAMEQYEAALRFKPDSPDLRFNWGNLYLQLGNVTGAIGQYEEALRLNPDHAPAHQNLGIALYRTGRFSEAIRHYEEAVRIVPGNAEARNSLGVVLLQLGKAAEAKAQFEEALRLKPDYAAARSNLAAAQSLLQTAGPKN